MDTGFSENTKDITAKFFQTTSAPNATVQRVMEEIKKRNEEKEFITQFAKENGYPVWNKVIIGTSIQQNNETSFINNNSNAEIDTTILIPFVLVGENTVEGFIKAEVKQRTIDLSYSLAKDYKAYEFKQDNSRASSTSFAYLNILLNKVVFGVNDYTITDPRLFSTDTGHVNSNNIHINDMNITFSTENTYRYITLCGSTTTQYGFCGTPDFCRRNRGCDAGNCPTGQCYFYYTTSTTCISTLIPLPDPMQGGGGTGGYGNTGEIPHAYPCTTPDNPTDPYTAQSNVVDPGNCPPPSGGPGWVPVLIEEPPFDPPTDSIPSNISRACDKELDSLYQWGMNNQFREQSFIVVKKNGSIYLKNFMPGFPGGDKTRVNYTLAAGEELLAYAHIHAEDTVNFYRSSFSPDDLIEFNKNAYNVGYTAILEVGNARYAFVLEDVQMKSNFNISKMGQHKKLFNAKFNTLTLQYPNGQTCSEQTWIQYLGSASVSGIGFYKATSPNKNNYIKLNP
ncbi:MAG: hypothetical protein ABS68_02555 [Niastella sp. SCN 39-18]|nr:hypothetical protein [Sphingobacteriales bacterium]ODT54225.1 MAG: hypothetical protein ABS68_02555 [Niastella sp. SCN 39-18]OJW09600.1 MAG: hypothetical protein BGO53_06985 [Sphingobacteriales bacterium 39-19]